MKFILSILSFTISFNVLLAQQQPCQSEQYKAFDFWIGEWMVTDTVGNPLGTNSIKKEESGCLVTEHWTGQSGGTGSSMNYYNPADSSWNQLWVSSNGFILKMKGEANLNQMVLTSDLSKNQTGQSIYHRITWTLNDDQTVTQLWQVLNDQKQVLSEAFRGIYAKK